MFNENTIKDLTIYECGICGCYHPWSWNGDCRDDANRFFPDEYAPFLGVDEFDLDIRDSFDRAEEYGLWSGLNNKLQENKK